MSETIVDRRFSPCWTVYDSEMKIIRLCETESEAQAWMHQLRRLDIWASYRYMDRPWSMLCKEDDFPGWTEDGYSQALFEQIQEGRKRQQAERAARAQKHTLEFRGSEIRTIRDRQGQTGPQATGHVYDPEKFPATEAFKKQWLESRKGDAMSRLNTTHDLRDDAPQFIAVDTQILLGVIDAIYTMIANFDTDADPSIPYEIDELIELHRRMIRSAQAAGIETEWFEDQLNNPDPSQHAVKPRDPAIRLAERARQLLDGIYPSDIFVGCGHCEYAMCQCDPGVQYIRRMRNALKDFDQGPNES